MALRLHFPAFAALAGGALYASGASAASAVSAAEGDALASAGILAESPFLADRNERPWNHFLLDGSQGFVAGRYFYQERGSENPFLWPADPFLSYAPDAAWIDDSARVVARALLGNEIGDAMLQELAQPAGEAEDNRTPCTAGSVSWSPLAGWRIRAGLDQNDHFSFSTKPARSRVVGEARRDDVAWFGGNVPPRSLADAGIAYARGDLSASARVGGGWWWTASPVSGRVRPWEGRSLEMDAGAGRARLALRHEAWDSPAPESDRAAWRHDGLRLAYGASPGAEGPRGWRAEAGWERRELRSDSVFEGFVRAGFPAAFSYWIRDALPGAAPARLSLAGSARLGPDAWMAEHSAALEEGAGAMRPYQRLDAYYRRPAPGSEPMVERVPGLGTARYREWPDARGLSAAAGLARAGEIFRAGAEAAWAGEWRAPVFRPEGFVEEAGSILRAGGYVPSSHVLWNGSLSFRLSGGDPAGRAFDLEAGWRRFFGADAGRMEFRPSRYWASARASWVFPSDLRAEARVNWVGAKEVRGWGPVFEVPSHFENALGLAQALPGRAVLRFSMLHAFGADLRERPNGNPLRFRVLGGAEAAF